jgi:hypothetical protein
MIRAKPQAGGEDDSASAAGKLAVDLPGVRQGQILAFSRK